MYRYPLFFSQPPWLNSSEMFSTQNKDHTGPGELQECEMDRVRRKIFMKAFDENETVVYRFKDLGGFWRRVVNHLYYKNRQHKLRISHTAVVVVSKFHNRCSNITHQHGESFSQSVCPVPQMQPRELYDRLATCHDITDKKYWPQWDVGGHLRQARSMILDHIQACELRIYHLWGSDVLS